VTEQRYKAVQGVLADGRTVGEVASQWEVSRRTLHRWLARYEPGGLERLVDGSHRPAHCTHQMSAAVEVLVLEMRRAHPYWGARTGQLGRSSFVDGTLRWLIILSSS